ncbi:MAG: glycosyltransferase family 87 protein [Xanthobacteraceae bacterium]
MTIGTSSAAVAPDFRLARPLELTLFALCVAQAVFLLASFADGLWLMAPDGSGKDTDFVNVWAAGQLVRDGHPAAAFDWTLHKAAQNAALGRAFESYYPWFYPPPFLLVASVLAAVPYAPAFAAWLAITLPAYAFTIRAIIGHRLGLLLACAFPGVVMNALPGQNGYVSAALMGGALHLMERRPALAGALIGLLTYKPHFGLLFPLVLAASGRWRVFASATLVTMLMAALSYAAFGAETWEAFIRSLSVVSKVALTQESHFRKIHSVFALVRALGGGEGLAWALHGTVMAATVVYVCLLWCSRAPFELKAAALATGALLITPYIYIYDLVILAVPMAFLVRVGRTGGFLPGEVAGLAAASLLILSFLGFAAPWGLAATAILAALIIRRVHVTPAIAPIS